MAIKASTGSRVGVPASFQLALPYSSLWICHKNHVRPQLSGCAWHCYTHFFWTGWAKLQWNSCSQLTVSQDCMSTKKIQFTPIIIWSYLNVSCRFSSKSSHCQDLTVGLPRCDSMSAGLLRASRKAARVLPWLPQVTWLSRNQRGLKQIIRQLLDLYIEVYHMAAIRSMKNIEIYWTKTSDNMWLLILVVSDMFDFHWFPTFFNHILPGSPGSPMPQVDPLAHQTCPSPMRPWKFHCFHWIWEMIGNDEWNSMEIMGNDGKTTNDEFFFSTGNDLRNPPSWTSSMTQRCLACHKSRSTAWLLSGFSRRKNKQLWAVGMLQWYSKLYANYMKQLNCLKSWCALPKTAAA